MFDEIQLPGPSDEWIASLIRHLCGLPPRAPVAREIIASWRRCICNEMVRHKQEREAGKRPEPPRIGLRMAKVTTDDVIHDMLASPEAQMWIGVASSLPEVVAGVIAAGASRVSNMQRFQAPLRNELAPIITYIDAKFGHCQMPISNDALPSPAMRAACNAVTPSRAQRWRSALIGGGETARQLLGEMREIGRAACEQANPLRLWDSELGLPRGIWPDPPPPDEVMVGSSSVAAGERPTFVVGGR